MIATSWTPRALGIMSSICTFLRLESAGGILLILAAGIAIICANTCLKHLYESFWEIPVYARPVQWISLGLSRLSQVFYDIHATGCPGEESALLLRASGSGSFPVSRAGA